MGVNINMKNLNHFLFFSFLFYFFVAPSINLSYAQDATSNCVITQIGNTGDNSSLPANCQSTNGGSNAGGNTAISKTALTLAAALEPCGVIDHTNYTTCAIPAIYKSNIPDPDAAAATLADEVTRLSGWPYQCIEFVQTVVAGTYKSPWNSWLDANSYINVNPYVVNDPSIQWTWIPIVGATPAEGDIPVFYHNHIAIITSIVDPTTGQVHIAEANVIWGSVGERNIVLPTFENDGIANDIAGWEHQQ